MSVLRFLGATVAAAVLVMPVVLFVAAWGLVVPGYAVWPITLGVGALLAAAAASWAGNVLTADRARLPAVIAVTGVAAVVICALLVAPSFSPAAWMLMPRWPLIYTIGGCVAVLSVTAGAAALRLRGERGRLGWDGAAALFLSAGVLAAQVLMEGPGLIPGIPQTGLASAGYERMVRIGLILSAAGVLMAVLRSRRISPGHELGMDAWITLALVAGSLPAVSEAFPLLCSTLVTCSG